MKSFFPVENLHPINGLCRWVNMCTVHLHAITSRHIFSGFPCVNYIYSYCYCCALVIFFDTEATSAAFIEFCENV